jgi:pimeloyl-ACP methyl ester carboxylesterase
LGRPLTWFNAMTSFRTAQIQGLVVVCREAGDPSNRPRDQPVVVGQARYVVPSSFIFRTSSTWSTGARSTIGSMVDLMELDDVAVVGHDSGGMIARQAVAGDARVRAMGLIFEVVDVRGS